MTPFVPLSSRSLTATRIINTSLETSAEEEIMTQFRDVITGKRKTTKSSG